MEIEKLLGDLGKQVALMKKGERVDASAVNDLVMEMESLKDSEPDLYASMRNGPVYRELGKVFSYKKAQEAADEAAQPAKPEKDKTYMDKMVEHVNNLRTIGHKLHGFAYSQQPYSLDEAHQYVAEFRKELALLPSKDMAATILELYADYINRIEEAWKTVHQCPAMNSINHLERHARARVNTVKANIDLGLQMMNKAELSIDEVAQLVNLSSEIDKDAEYIPDDYLEKSKKLHSAIFDLVMELNKQIGVDDEADEDEDESVPEEDEIDEDMTPDEFFGVIDECSPHGEEYENLSENFERDMVERFIYMAIMAYVNDDRDTVLRYLDIISRDMDQVPVNADAMAAFGALVERMQSESR